ncbi:MAG: LysE family translocator [Candidatus Poseidonia sp.]|jgi:threonine/homoserine/homoserine lactone efflux protein|uniref:LysE family translocator n=1 Tax=Poseidonia sp. TaxID=2666344 RepID=UPI0030BF39E3|nr:LysE family translocator [Poseidonia sp.]
MAGLEWDILLAAGLVLSLGAISPGPSLMVVLRNTMMGGRRQGVACALGHGLGFGVYAGLAVFGLIVLLEEAPNVFLTLQLIGCGLLAWYGYSMWTMDGDFDSNTHTASKRQGFTEGFAIAFFNPKIALFLVAVLAQVLRPGMGFGSKVAVGLLGMTIDTLWYLTVAVGLTGTSLLDTLKKNGTFIHRLTAVILWGFALSIVFQIN